MTQKLYQYLHKLYIGRDQPGGWNLSPGMISKDIIENLAEAKWQPGTLLYFNEANVEKTARHLDLDKDLVRSWIFDPQYKKYHDQVISFSVLDPVELELKQILLDTFSLYDDADIRLQIQHPGEMVPLHLDIEKHLVFDQLNPDRNKIKRYAIFLDDQWPGQVWSINKDFVTWKKGDVLTWEHSRAPHGTANFGYHDRPIVVVTGAER